ANLFFKFVIVGYLEEPATIGVELAFDGMIGAALHPILDAIVDRVRSGCGQIKMPAITILAVRILERLLADDFGGVVAGQVYRQDVTLRGLSDQALLSRDADAGF